LLLVAKVNSARVLRIVSVFIARAKFWIHYYCISSRSIHFSRLIVDSFESVNISGSISGIMPSPSQKDKTLFNLLHHDETTIGALASYNFFWSMDIATTAGVAPPINRVSVSVPC
jgi:hypothetical protein